MEKLSEKTQNLLSETEIEKEYEIVLGVNTWNDYIVKWEIVIARVRGSTPKIDSLLKEVNRRQRIDGEEVFRKRLVKTPKVLSEEKVLSKLSKIGIWEGCYDDDD